MKKTYKFVKLTKREKQIIEIIEDELSHNFIQELNKIIKDAGRNSILLMGEGVSIIATKKDLNKLRELEDTWVRDGLIR